VRLAVPVGQPAVPYFLTAITVDGVTTREVECLNEACGDIIDGCDHWFGGVMEEHTHIGVLRSCMADRCGLRECPHRDTFGATP
jgi:hypothetical protein